MFILHYIPQCRGGVRPAAYPAARLAYPGARLRCLATSPLTTGALSLAL